METSDSYDDDKETGNCKKSAELEEIENKLLLQLERIGREQ